MPRTPAPLLLGEPGPGEPAGAGASRLDHGEAHAAKLARYYGLVPEVGAALAKHTAGAAAKRLAAFRESCPGWWLAAGDRLIGGENYCSPPHLVRALFAGAAQVERVPAADLSGWVDVPWCAADLYFIEKAALALRAGQTRNRRPSFGARAPTHCPSAEVIH
jgi:hypothetical protein